MRVMDTKRKRRKKKGWRKKSWTKIWKKKKRRSVWVYSTSWFILTILHPRSFSPCAHIHTQEETVDLVDEEDEEEEEEEEEDDEG